MYKMILTALLIFAATDAFAAVEGHYRANGTDAPPKYALAKWGDPYMDKPTTKVILSEKDASKESSPDFSAQMGDLGSAIVITLVASDDGYDVIGAEFAHPALKRSGVSSIGILEARDVVVANGTISGQIVSVADASIFDEPVEIDLKFSAKSP
ncbi:hypothetical protein [Dokdonella sp.]|uniref:hypothetical protein n=1 Tax=Dokdonella sp. TaxID=2291710 RepID=UPI0035276264